VTKRDFRRDLDVEIRREGHDYFGPNLDLPASLQTFPGLITNVTITRIGAVATVTRSMGQWFEVGETVVIAGANDPAYNGQKVITAVTATSFSFAVVGAPPTPDPSTTITATPIEDVNLVALARRPNGQTAVIAGSHRRLYRYYALDDPDYITEDPDLWPLPDVPPYWSVNPADYPPLTPVDELEYVDSNPGYWIVIGSGFATDGNRWETVNINGYMVFNNGKDLPVTYRVEELEVIPIYQLREQGVAYAATMAELNGILMFGDIAEIDPDELENWFNTAADPYARYTDAQYIDRTTYRVMWGTPGEPRLWSPIVPGSIAAGTNVLSLDYPVLGFNIGESITIVGAGESHAGGTADNLEATIVNINDTSIVLDAFASTTVTSADVQATSQIGSIVGFEDLQDDGSGIVKMLPISSTLVVYKDTTIFLGQYTGNVDQPFVFTNLEVQKEACPFYRNTVVLVQTQAELFHLYAGRNAFWRFDLTNQQPMSLPKFESCSNIFYDQATLENTERIFGCDNGLTHEIFFVFPSAIEDRLLAFDYKQDTLATGSALITSGATVRKPIAGLTAGVEEDWFVMGNNQGAVLLYGRTTIDQALPDWDNSNSIYFRRESNPYSATKIAYTSLLLSGLSSFGSDYSEKQCRAFRPILASQSENHTINVVINTALNPNSAVVPVAAVSLTNPLVQCNIPLGVMGYYLQSQISVAGVDNPIRLAASEWDVCGIDSRSIGRSI